ncbi:FCD domain-containing protein [Benzoatithermus flavus]|uniref:FCD domain-containing protein n=1 Tax=Benzoatithermus flavus TaxID=3108223 RepID=UPI003AAD3A4A
MAERLAAMIIAGELANGQRLPPERHLMRRFGVGRSVVREAIASLAHRGLLVTRSGCRPIVRPPSYEGAVDAIGRLVGHLLTDESGIHNLFESRVLVEAALVRQAAVSARREDIEELRAALEANHAAIGQPDAFYATDVAFHGVLYRIARNPIFPALHKAYVQWLMGYWRRLTCSPDIDRLNHVGHCAIFEAILARDPDEAEAALRRHLQVAWELVRGALAGRETTI